MVVQNTNKYSRGNINGKWKRFRGISGSFVQTGTIINEHGRKILRFFYQNHLERNHLSSHKLSYCFTLSFKLSCT